MERLKEPNIEWPIKIPRGEDPFEYITRNYWWIESDYVYKDWKILNIKDI